VQSSDRIGQLLIDPRPKRCLTSCLFEFAKANQSFSNGLEYRAWFFDPKALI